MKRIGKALILALGLGATAINVVTAQTTGLENLGPNINTADRENNPIPSPDGKTLYFVRGTGDNGEIYFSTLQSDGKWGKAEAFGYPLNNNKFNAVQGVTADGNRLMLLNQYNPDASYKGIGLSISDRSGKTWRVPTDVNIPGAQFSGATSYFLSGDGRTLLLAITNPYDREAQGGTDLYVSFMNERNEWSAPINLGPTINTGSDEITPFLASDGVSLYFSSKGHGSSGDHDIFVASRLDESWKKWSAPQNLGKGINTPGFDGYFKISADGKYAYVVSNQNSLGERDIFRYKLPGAIAPALLPKAAVLVSGKVLNAKTKQPIEATIRVEKLPEGSDAGFAKSDALTGDYKIILPSGSVYGFYATVNKFAPVSENVDLSKQAKYEELKKDLLLVPMETGVTVRINNIFFETSKSDLQPASFPELDRLVKMLKDNPNMKIEVAGHTDNTGSDAVNEPLSLQRAEAVKKYVSTKDAALANRITTKGYGSKMPVKSNDSAEGRRENRRVEFKILSQ